MHCRLLSLASIEDSKHKYSVSLLRCKSLAAISVSPYVCLKYHVNKGIVKWILKGSFKIILFLLSKRKYKDKQALVSADDIFVTSSSSSLFYFFLLRIIDFCIRVLHVTKRLKRQNKTCQIHVCMFCRFYQLRLGCRISLTSSN